MKIFPQFPWLRATISEKCDGNMRIGPEIIDLERSAREENRKRFLENETFSSSLVTPYLAHGNSVAVVSDASLPYLQNCDALVTSVSGLSVGVTIADCVPVFFADPVLKVIGLAHAGWRGLTAGVLEETLRVFRGDFGSRSENISVVIGPHIGACHFEVQKDVFDMFVTNERFIRHGKYYADLSSVCINILCAHGVKKEWIQSLNQCTHCEQDVYFSHRRDKSVDIEAMMAVMEIV